MVLNQDIFAIRRNIGSRYEMETPVTKLFPLKGAITDIRLQTKIAYIFNGYGIRCIVIQTERYLEYLAYIIINFGDDIDGIREIIIHQRFVIMTFAIRIFIPYEIWCNRLHRHIDGINGRLLKPYDSIVFPLLVIIAKRADEEIVGSVIYTTGHILPIPSYRFRHIQFAGTLSSFLIGSDDIFRCLIALHPNIARRYARTSDTRYLDDILFDIKCSALLLFPIHIPLQRVAVVNQWLHTITNRCAYKQQGK